MNRSPTLALAAALLLVGCGLKDELASVPPPAPTPTSTPMAAPAAMKPTIARALPATPRLTTLAGAVRAAGFDTTLAGAGPFTVFAPTDAAFARLAPGTVDNLLKPENRTPLTKLLGYHVVAGALTAADLAQRIAAGGGSATLATIEGDPLTASLTGTAITLADVNGNKSYVETADLRQTNGVIHIVNGVLVPHLG